VETLPRDDVRLHVVTDALRRRVVLILSVVVVLTAAVAALVLSRATSYTSGAKVLVRPIAGNALSLDSARNAQQVTVAMETEAGLVNSPEVAALVTKALGSTVSAGSKAVSASVPPNTQIVQIEFTGTSPELARKGAQAYADSFLRFREALAKDTLGRQRDIIKKQEKKVKDSFDKVAEDAAADSPAPDSAALVQLYSNRLASLQESIGTIEATDTNAGSIVTPANVPDASGGLSPVLLIGIGGFLSLAAAVALAVWRERSDDRVRATSETAVAGVPVIANVPRPQAATPVVIAPDDERLADSFRRARAAVLVRVPRPAVVAIAAIDALPPSLPIGAIAANLAMSLARAENRVCVVDAATDDCDLAALLGLPMGPGLAEELRGDGDEESVVEPVAAYGLDVLGRGCSPQGIRELYASGHFSSCIDRLRQGHDYVVVAAPAAGTSIGGEVTLATDGVLLVVSDERTTHAAVAAAVERSTRLGVPVLGLLAVARSGRRLRRRRPKAAPAGQVRAEEVRAEEVPAEEVRDKSAGATPLETASLEPASSSTQHDAG
jgi:polysaccharide biosynthesis transport protein